MIDNSENINSPILTGRLTSSFTPMYSMHKYWSRKSSEIVSEYLKKYSKPEDIVLDPFSGSGVTIIEAIKLGRKAIGIDINPVANFITKVTLEPVNLSQLKWAYRDIEAFCLETLSNLFSTRCPLCGEFGDIDFVVKHFDESRQIGYRCRCSNQRLFKQPDQFDKQQEEKIQKLDVPHWYPSSVLIHSSRKEKYKYVHELFTKRNLIALSSILHYVDKISNERVKNVLKLAFSASLANASRLKPLSKQKNGRPTLQEGWTAVRFYTPPDWLEVNPILVFKKYFERAYEGKKESNAKLKDVRFGSTFEELKEGKANVVLFQGSCDLVARNMLPRESVNHILTDPPFGDAIQYLDLSTFWGAWLKFEFDYDHEIVINSHEKTRKIYEDRMLSTFQEMRRVLKKGSYIHVFYSDAQGPNLHMLINNLMKAGVSPQKIVHQPQPSSFSNAVRPRRGIPKKKGGFSGSYIIRGKISDSEQSPIKLPIFEKELRKKIAGAAQQTIDFQNGEATVGSVLHSVYSQLDENEIATYAQFNAKDFVQDSVKEFAQLTKRGKLVYIGTEKIGARRKAQIRKIRRALLDAHSLIADEEDRLNRVRQIAEKRLNMVGITPENIQHSKIKIPDKEISKNRLRIFTSLYTSLGREFGFRVIKETSIKNILTWKKENSLNIHFKIFSQFTNVSTTLPENGDAEDCHWGTISHTNLELRLKQWCDNNPSRGNNIRKILAGLEGPSFSLENIQKGIGNDFHNLELKVVYNKEWCKGHYLMKLQAPRYSVLNIRPGQFFHIICDPNENLESEKYPLLYSLVDKSEKVPLTLRRPFSIHGTQHKGFIRTLLSKSGQIPIEIREILDREISHVDILYKVIGKGTTKLSERIKKNSIIDAIGPCGNGFKIHDEQYSVIVAGGIGIAPLVALAEQLRYYDKKVYVYFGTFNKELLSLALTRSSRSDSTTELSYLNGVHGFPEAVQQDFKGIGVDEVKICTYNDAFSEAKVVTELLEQDLESKLLPNSNIWIYACGPRGMLKSVAEISAKYSVKCDVLLEQRMACGIGTCYSCTCETLLDDGSITKKRVCVDGPVFSSKDIKW